MTHSRRSSRTSIYPDNWLNWTFLLSWPITQKSVASEFPYLISYHFLLYFLFTFTKTQLCKHNCICSKARKPGNRLDRWRTSYKLPPAYMQSVISPRSVIPIHFSVSLSLDNKTCFQLLHYLPPIKKADVLLESFLHWCFKVGVEAKEESRPDMMTSNYPGWD